MSYRFVRCQTHPKCPDVIGWYLVLEPGDIDTLMKLHKGVAYLYFHKFGMDPHLKPDSEEGVLKNPIRLAAGWLRSVENFLAEGTTLAVNSNGGIVPLDSVKILSEQENEKLNWPDYYDDEVITISHWSGGTHYYLSSNKGRVFVPSKYATHKAARVTAEHYTSHIETKENATPLPDFR